MPNVGKGPQADQDGRIVAFHEKPAHPTPLPNEPGLALASMGNHLFRTSTLVGAMGGSVDFGKEILPALIHSHHVHAFDFRRSTVLLDFKDEGASYWRDVGTLDAYHEANMDLRAVISR